MIRRVRELQPPHHGDKFTVAQAIRAFREVRGDNPKPDIFDESERKLVFRDASGSLFIADSPEEIPAQGVPLTKCSPATRKRR
jgi:hypothetical protein